MGLLTLQDVSQTYGERTLLDGISMVVSDNDRIGILGPNGSGKSTLLRIIAGVEVPDHGQRTTRRGLQIDYLEQDPSFAQGETILDAIRSGFANREATLVRLDALHEELAHTSDDMDVLDALLAEQARLETTLETQGGHDVEFRIETVAHHVGLGDLHARCGTLSGGERRRVALARLLLRPADLWILDEPTNHLDAEVTAWLEQRLLEARTPLILVTHDRYFLDRIVTRTIEIERGALHEYDGGYAEFLSARAARLENEASAEASRANVLRRESEWMRRGPPARTTKAKARIDRYENLVANAPAAAARDLEFRIPPGPRLGERVLEFQGVRAGYGDRVLIDGLDLEIGARTRLGIVGPNGAGKSTFLKLCLGELEPMAGTVRRGSTVRFAAIDQNRTQLDPDKTVLEEVSGSNDFVHVDGRAVRIESFLNQFLFPGAMKHARIGSLSGGERNRVLLAKLLSAGGNVLILDEPTNDLDLMTLRVLEEALVAFEGVVLVVSHDRYFLDRVADRVLYFDGHGGLRVHEGDLSLLLERLDRERSDKSTGTARPTVAKNETTSKPGPAPNAPPKLSSRELQELTALPESIAKAEGKLAELDRQLADPATWVTGSGAKPSLPEDRAAAKREVDRLFARWEELETRREAHSKPRGA